MVEHEIALTKKDRLILLGDYIDRGNESKKVIDYILDSMDRGFDLIPLSGNHEAMLINACDNHRYLQQWLYNGGGITLQSFGITSVHNLGSRYIQFFRTLPTYFETGDFLFVHAGFDEDSPEPFLAIHHQLWYCREKYFHEPFSEKLVIHGHCPVKLEKLKIHIGEARKVLGIDTGCVYKQYEGFGYLTAINVNTLELFSL